MDSASAKNSDPAQLRALLPVSHVEPALEEAVRAGKITPAARDAWRERLTRDAGGCLPGPDPAALAELVALPPEHAVPLTEIGSDAVAEPPVRELPEGAELELITGYLDDVRKLLGPADELYPVFAQAWQLQDTWTSGEHRRFWEATIRLWPARRGNPQRRERMAFVVTLARDAGVDDAELAERLGVSYETWRDAGVFKQADATEKRIARGPAGPLLPRIQAPHDPVIEGGFGAVISLDPATEVEPYSTTERRKRADAREALAGRRRRS